MRALIFVMVLFLIKQEINAQAYRKLLEQSNYWSVVSCNFGCLTDNYYAIEDTVIGNYTYKFLDNYHYNKNMFLREDTIERKIYFRSRLDNKDILLYDFSLNVGDSMELNNPISPLPESSGTYILDSIVVRNILDGPRRYFYLSSINGIDNTVWIEGIGSLSLINTPAAAPDPNYIGELKCFFQNASHVYEADSLINGPCDSSFILSVPVYTEVMPFELFPNPNKGIFTVKFPQTIQHGEILLRDILGNTLKTISIQNQENILIETANLRGVYFVDLITDSKRIVKRIVIH